MKYRSLAYLKGAIVFRFQRENDYLNILYYVDPVNIGTKGERKDSRSEHSAFTDDRMISVISAIIGALMFIILATVLILRRHKDLCRRRTRFAMIEESRYERLTTGTFVPHII